MGSRACREGADGRPLEVWRNRSEPGPAGQRHGPAPLAVVLRWRGRDALVAVHGEIDCATAGVLSAHLSQVAARRPARLVIDLAGVAFMDCAGVNAIVRARRELPAACPLVLRSASPVVRRLIAITGLDLTCRLQDGPPRRPARPRCPDGSRLSHWQPSPGR